MTPQPTTGFSTRRTSFRPKTDLRGEILKAFVAAAAAVVAAILLLQAAQALPVSLNQVPVPKPDRLADFVADEAAAVRLGKALFWDLQAGSDAATACASCHFHAGTDRRVKNTMGAGGDGTFDAVAGPNSAVSLASFPFHRMVNAEERGTGGIDPDDPAVLFDTDDVVGSQGVPEANLLLIAPGAADELALPVKSKVFQHHRRNVRQVTGRNTPTTINAVFTVSNFWDGRANHYFNGVNPFGPQDPNAKIWVASPSGIEQKAILLNNASLASQAVGPPMSEVEMRWNGRTFPDLGRKMLSLRPLGKQVVHPSDSVLGTISRSKFLGDLKAGGLETAYPDLIRAAFHPQYWDSGARTPAGHTLMEANFPLFWGLSIMLYEATLVSDDTPFDRYLQGQVTALTQSQQQGLSIFFSGATACGDCHIGAELTGNAISVRMNPFEPGLVEVMPMGDNQSANYDLGFYNVGVRPISEDRGRGGLDPFGNPLSYSRQAVIKAGLVPGTLGFDTAFVPSPGCIPDPFAIPDPRICPPTTIARTAVDGAFKVPGLRNIELTGPYFHNGGMSTLDQVIDFYIRGSDFREANIADLDPVINGINGLKGPSAAGQREALVDFLLALTDDRVRWEKAPFDHPQLFIPAGHSNAAAGDPRRHRGTPLATTFEEIPAVGAGGRAPEGLEQLRPFLWNGDSYFHFGDWN